MALVGFVRRTTQAASKENWSLPKPKRLLTTETINQVAKQIVDLCKNESNTLTIKRLQKLIRDCKGNGKLDGRTGERRNRGTHYTAHPKKQLEKQDLEKQLAENDEASRAHH